MYKIPEEFRDLPEADRLRKAESSFSAAAQEGRRLTFENAERVRVVGEQMRRAQNELQQAQKAFDRATGEPNPVGLTAAVVDEIGKQFPVEEHGLVKEIMDERCGRTIPFQREATAGELEHIRLCVLRLSKGNLSELRRWIELANVDPRDVLLAAAPLMSS